MLGSSSVQWDLRAPLGSNISWTLSMFQADGITPFVMTGHTFEYVVKDEPGGQPGTTLIRLRSDASGSPTPAGGGLVSVAVTSVLAAVMFALYPPATTPLAVGTYYHAMWMDYADPVNALNLFWGQFMIDPAVQP